MPEAILHPELVKIRDKFPASKCLVDRWNEVVALVNKGEIEKAEQIAKQCINDSPKLKVRNAVAVRHRILRREYLRFQRDLEGEIRKPLETLSDKIGKLLVSASDSDGKIPLAKLNRILDRTKKLNSKSWGDVRTMVVGGVRDSVRWGMTVSMKSAQLGVEKARENVKTNEKDQAVVMYVQQGLVIERIEMDVVVPEDFENLSEAESTALILRTSAIFKTIIDRVKKRRIQKGLFKTRVRGVHQTGFKLSQQVWDIRDNHLQRLRRVVANGIGSGRAASAIANDVKAMTTVGKIAVDVPLPRGMARSAYKNALRVARTETNNAYIDAELEYARHKGYKKMWNVAPGHNVADSCDDLGGQVFDPDDVPFPQHPNDACFLTTVIPGIG